MAQRKVRLKEKPQVKRTTYYPPLCVEWTTSLESTISLIRYCNSEASWARRGAWGDFELSAALFNYYDHRWRPKREEADTKRQRVAAMGCRWQRFEYYTGSTGTRLNLFHDTCGLWGKHSWFVTLTHHTTSTSAKINLIIYAFIVSIHEEIGTFSNEIFDREY